MTSSFLFQGKNIELRAFEAEDIPRLYEYLNHPLLSGRRYIPWEFSDLHPLSKKKCEAIYQKWSELKKGFTLGIYLNESNELIGHVVCDWEWDTHSTSLAVLISPSYQRKRYGSEALSLLFSYLYGYTPAYNVNCWIADWNNEGRAFAQNHGFSESGRMRRVGTRQGKYYDMVLMDILRDEWKNKVGGKKNGS
ncbi:MAG: GNAT family N-acetyltransferase [Candidatus Hodarchaeales archaeon]|jgi:RimJ/RimL family protein N-acetyltransferase